MKQAEKQTSFEPPGPTKKLSEKQPPPRPIALPVDPRKIPQELKKHRQWLVWRYEKRNSKWTKPPKNAENGLGGKSDDPSTWTSFEKTWKAYEKEGYDGIGFALSCEDGLVGLDLDHCFNKAGELAPWAREVVNHFPEAYWERSPGGEGLRGFCRGVPVASGKGGPNNWIEVYQPPSHRYLTVTGHKLPESPKEPGDGQKGLNWLYQTYWEKKEETKPGALRPPSVVVDLDDQELLEKAFHARNGAEFSRLWNGDISNYPSNSEADQALCNHLAFWTRGDAHRMEHLARQSGLCREKWDKHPTYLATTIEKAISSCSQFYDPQSVAPCRPKCRPLSPQVSPLPKVNKNNGVEKVSPLSPLSPPVYDQVPISPRKEKEITYPFTRILPLAEELHRETKHPLSACGNIILSKMNFAAQGLADVALPLGGVKPLSENFMNSLPSGARKTYTDSVASVGVERRQIELWDAYHEEMKEWKNKEAVYKRKREHILINKKLSQEQMDEELGKLVDPPPEPLSPRICMGGDPTPEGHYKQLQRGYASQYFDEDEGGMTLGSHAWTREVQQRTMSFYNKLWDGKALDRTRSADGDHIIRARRLSSLIAVQPAVARDLLDNQLAKEVGFLSRWLIVEPEPLHGTRFEDPDEERPPSQALQTFNDRVYELLKIPLRLREGTQNELAPRVIGFNEEARRVWFSFYNEVENQLGPGGEYEEIFEFASKAAEHAGRLAATIAIFENPEARFISAQDAAEGIALARFYMHEHLRLAGGDRPDLQAQKAQKLIDWLRGSWREKYGDLVSISDVSKIGPKSCRGKSYELIEFLVLHGHLQEENGPAEIRGKRRRKVFRILDDEDQEAERRGDRGDRGDTVERQGKELGDTWGDSKSVAPSLLAPCLPGSSPLEKEGRQGRQGRHR